MAEAADLMPLNHSSVAHHRWIGLWKGSSEGGITVRCDRMRIL